MDLLRDMLKYAEEALSLAEGKSSDDLEIEKSFNYALQHCFTIIGEAASLVSQETRNRLPNIAWPEIIGMRNWIVHRYERVNSQILWATTQKDLPELIQEILSFLPPEQA